MPNIYEVADKFDAELLGLEMDASNRLLDEYGTIWRRVKRQLDKVLATIEAERAAGRLPMAPPVMGGLSARQLGGYSWAVEIERTRLQGLLRQLSLEMAGRASYASLATQEAQAEAIIMGRRHARRLYGAAVEGAPDGFSFDWVTPNLDALNAQIGFLADGSPLAKLFAQLGPDAERRMRQALIEGLARGYHPSKIAALARKAFANSTGRALLIARTEMMRSYRRASSESYQANSDVLRGWVWHAKLDTRTCGSCWAMHGTEHDLEDVLNDHPRGRCAMVPLTKTWADLGIKGVKDTNPQIRSGEDAFRRLPARDQRAILGPSKHKAYQAGELALADFSHERGNADWGSMRTAATMAQAKRAAKKRRR